jgi:tRNA(adenine34) deaminase
LTSKAITWSLEHDRHAAVTIPFREADVAGMRAALAQAQAGLDAGEVPIGAVVIRSGSVVALAHNETVARSDPTAHAELLATQRALAALGTDRLADATLYVTLEPCAQCAGALVLAKVERVVFGAWDPKAGMSGSLHDLLRHSGLNHQAEVVGGVGADESAALLRQFFEARR